MEEDQELGPSLPTAGLAIPPIIHCPQSYQFMTVEKWGIGNSRCRGQNPHHQGTAQTHMQGQIVLQLVPPKSCPPEAGMVIGKVSTHTPCDHNMALLSSCPAKPRRDSETAAAPYHPFLQKQVQIYFRTGEPHPLTLTQRPKVTKEAPIPKGRRETQSIQ